MCFFELHTQGSCRRKKCKFQHDVSVLRSHEDLKHSKMQELSEKIGKCTYDMVKKGSCPKVEGCRHKHHTGFNDVGTNIVCKKSGSSIRSVSGFCFKEAEKADSCLWGKKCKFSHDISLAQRTDENFLRQVREEKLSKASKCVNEYMRPGSCKKGPLCSFGHIFSEEEKSDPEFRNKMDAKWTSLVGERKIPKHNSNPESKYNSDVQMKDVWSFLKEFQVLVSSMNFPRNF